MTITSNVSNATRAALSANVESHTDWEAFRSSFVTAASTWELVKKAYDPTACDAACNPI